MGRTIVVNKMAAAFRGSDGCVHYLVFSQTYSSNTDPQIPRWCCNLIGGIEEIIEWVFVGADCCVGGSVEGPKGYISPESYIAGWLKELRDPIYMTDREITLKLGHDFYSTVPVEKEAKAIAALKTIGREDVAKTLLAGESVDISLHRDTEIVLALFNKAGIYPWLAIPADSIPWHGNPRDTNFGYAPPRTARFQVSVPETLSGGKYGTLMRDKEGVWRSVGDKWQLLANFVRDLWRQELVEPGSYRKRIKAYRSALEHAPLVPLGTQVTVDPSAAMQDYERDRIHQFMVEQGIQGGGRFVVQATEDNMYSLTHFPAVSTAWALPEVVSSPAAPVELTEPQQLGLFAA